MQYFYFDKEQEFTLEHLAEFIKKHKSHMRRYKELANMYEGDHEILHKDNKAPFKPDNRLVVNFAKYIVDTLNGYFIGNPIKTTHTNEQVAEYLEFVEKYNNQDDNNAELAKMCSIFGHAYELVYLNEQAQIGITYIKPTEAFIVYDNSIVKRPLFGVRYSVNTDGEIVGTYSDNAYIYYFKEGSNGLMIIDQQPNYFGDVPLIEYVENAERQGSFENVITLINAFNNAISEKANDVDYYADAYLKVLGVELTDEQLKQLRDSRIFNVSGDNGNEIIIDFLSKPNSDTTQENLIDRLERLIYHISMVANINDENFGNASGISLKFKLQSMNNLCMTKERKFTAGMNKRWQLIANVPNSKIGQDDWVGIKYRFTRNIPSNELEETQIAGNLAGITSKETQLKVLSVVEDVTEEMKRIEEEQGSIDLFGADEDEQLLEEYNRPNNQSD